jgi:uncharacterized protein with GYD domain
MPKYLYNGSYTLEGVRGLIKEGGSSRRAQVESTVKGLGGKMEAFYFAFGGNDVYSRASCKSNTEIEFRPYDKYDDLFRKV